MPGGWVTVNVAWLLCKPFTVTTTGPDVAPVGTFAETAPTAQLVGVAAVPLKVTVLVLCAAPKSLPLMVTLPPIAPEGGWRFVMEGGAVKGTALLGDPLTTTTSM